MNEVRVLGSLEVVADGELRSLGGPRRRRLLAVLVLNANRVVPNDRLLDLVWGADVERGVLGALRTEISRLRATVAGVATIAAEGDGYRLDIDEARLDVARFEELIATAGSHRGDDLGEAVGLLSEAVGLWRGRPFDEIADTVAAAASEGQRLQELQLNALVHRVELRLEAAGGRGDAVGEVVAELRGLVEEHPLQERLWGLLMTALYRSGRQADALAAFQRARMVLVEDLGLEPSDELVLLEQQVLAHDPALDPQSPAANLTNKGHQSGEQPRETLPTGTVTFLFSDIEGSTRLWGVDAAAMSTSLGVHDEVVRTAIESHGGYIFTTAGDAFCAAFGRASDALAAATAAQDALNEATWPGPRLAVRVALHSGEAEERHGDYFGPAVNLASRIMAAGHGGQVLLSDATAQLLAGSASGEVLLSLGQYRLKGIRAPQLIWQYGLQDEFEPLRSRHKIVLPPRREGFVGRDADVEAISDLLTDHRGVTVTGPGGIGKTRLSLEVGWRVAPLFPDGVWFCDLAAVGDGSGVARAAMTALDVPPQAGEGPIESVVAALGNDRALVIMDNCEHVLHAAGEVVGALLAGCQRLAVLATSRERLGLADELVRPLAPLRSDTDAVELFALRAGAVDSGFNVEDHRAEVVELCEQLDGIPLAIELAAARARTLGPADLLARMGDRFRLLRSRHRVSGSRQQTLLATVEWSYRLLDEDARQLFDRLSVFAGSFDLDAVTAVCTDASLDEFDGFDVLDILDDLVDKSLVLPTDRGDHKRYRLLETLRQFGAARLDETAGGEIFRRRHGDYYASLAREAQRDYEGSDSVTGMETFKANWDNIRHAAVWSLTADEAEMTRDLIKSPTWFGCWTGANEVGDWARQATERYDDEPLYWGIAARFALNDGLYDLATELANKGLVTTDEVTGPDTVLCYCALAVAAMHRRELEPIEGHQQNQQDAAEAAGDRFAVALTRAGRIVTSASFHPDQALDYVEIARPYVEDLGAVSLDALFEVYVASAHQAVGNLDTAARHFDIALEKAALVDNANAESLALAWRSVRAPHDQRYATYLDTLRRLRERRDWMAIWVVLESLTTHLANTDAELAGQILGLLEHRNVGHGALRFRRQQAIESINAHPKGRSGFAHGETLDRDSLLDNTIEALAQRAATH